MAQRILEPGEIEALAQRSIPQYRLPDVSALFARRSARLRQLAADAEIGDFLRFASVIAQAQHTALEQVSVEAPTREHLQRCSEHGMPPFHPTTWRRAPSWRGTLKTIVAAVTSDAEFPPAVYELTARLHAALPQWLDEQADCILLGEAARIDVATAPFIISALQVHWSALAASMSVANLAISEVSGLCPLCGTPPVAGVVRANRPYQGYRYLQCALCATEWHMVRVQCSGCGASGKNIAYHTASLAAQAKPGADADDPVRAETCESCRGYRKMFYEERDSGVEPIADDLATLRLDLLLGELQYHRLSGNPLLWQPYET